MPKWPNITKIKYGAPPKAVARELRRKCVEVKVQWCVQVVKPVTRALTLGRTSGGGMSHPYEVLFLCFHRRSNIGNLSRPFWEKFNEK